MFVCLCLYVGMGVGVCVCVCGCVCVCLCVCVCVCVVCGQAENMPHAMTNGEGHCVRGLSNSTSVPEGASADHHGNGWSATGRLGAACVCLCGWVCECVCVCVRVQKNSKRLDQVFFNCEIYHIKIIIFGYVWIFLGGYHTFRRTHTIIISLQFLQSTINQF